MSVADVGAVLDCLDRAHIDAWLDGGWGVDALLGRQTRSHNDLDLLVRTVDVARIQESLGNLGFRRVEGGSDFNFVLRDAQGHEVDVHAVRFDDDGLGIYRMENGVDWMFPAGGFDGRGSVGGRDVECLTAHVQMLTHSQGYEPSETDFHDMRLLNAHFGTPLLPPFDRVDE
jgi:lincosamide nucleotidyltransferase A/C/D/E